jgi:hypothetical protein
MSGPRSDTTLAYQYFRRDRQWYVRPVRVSASFAAGLARLGPCVFVHRGARWRDTRESLYNLTEGAEEWLDSEAA